MLLPSTKDGYTVFSTEEIVSMAVFKGAVIACKVCASEFRVPPSRASSASTCSKECADKVRGYAIERKVQILCKTCSQAFRVPRCHEERHTYCSKECRAADTDARMAQGAKVIGEANGAWVGGKVPHPDGYVYERSYRHPFAQNGYVLQHRLAMERYLRETDPASLYLTEIDGEKYLSPAYHVHHKDEVKDSNAIDNLQCMTPQEHAAHHNELVKKALAFYRLHHPAGE